MENYLESSLSQSTLGKSIIHTNDNNINSNSSLCAKITNVLDEIYNDSTTNNAQITNTKLISNKLSVNEISILECGLVVADISNLSKDIENEYTNVVQKNEEDILEAISIIDRFNEVVVPSLESDLESIQQLLTSLEERQINHMKDQQYKWMKIFNLSSSYTTNNDIKQRREEEHAKYNYQISSCNLHDSNTLINQLTSNVDNNHNNNVKHKQHELIPQQQQLEYSNNDNNNSTTTSTTTTSSSTSKEREEDMHHTSSIDNLSISS